MPKGLKRYYGRGHLHFITFSCYGRRPLLRAVRAKNLFLKELARVRREYAFALVGYVVMPEHVHLLVSEPKKGTPSTVLQMLKQRVSRKMRQKKTGYGIAQVRFHFLRRRRVFRSSGRRDSTISMSTRRERDARNSITCTAIRWHGSWYVVRKIGRGAVICSMKKAKRG